MRISWYRYIGVFLLLAWLVCFTLPVVDAAGGVRFNGFEAMLVNFGGFVFVDTLTQYFTFLFFATPNLWILILLIRLIMNKHYRLLPTAFFSFLALSSAFTWVILEDHKEFLLYGYWTWLAVVFLTAVFSISRSLVSFENEKQEGLKK